MYASALIAARVFLKHMKGYENRKLREYIRLSVYPNLVQSSCPTVPDLVRTYYDKLVHYYTEQRVTRSVNRHVVHGPDNSPYFDVDFLASLPRPPPVDLFVGGGHPDFFLASILNAAFGSEHVLMLGVPVTELDVPKVEELAIVIMPGEFQKRHGIITHVDTKAQEGTIDFQGPSRTFSFGSFLRPLKGFYPISPPPYAKTLPNHVRYVTKCETFSPALSTDAFGRTLPTITYAGSVRGYRVVGMIVSIGGHAVACFPCVTFDKGWMFCNTWEYTGPCATFEKLLRQYSVHKMRKRKVTDVTVVYVRRSP